MIFFDFYLVLSSLYASKADFSLSTDSNCSYYLDILLLIKVCSISIVFSKLLSSFEIKSCSSAYSFCFSFNSSFLDTSCLYLERISISSENSSGLASLTFSKNDSKWFSSILMLSLRIPYKISFLLVTSSIYLFKLYFLAFIEGVRPAN